MTLPELWLGAPALHLPHRRESNDDVVARVRSLYRGTPEDWRQMERRIRFLFTICGSEWRHIEDRPVPVAGHAATAARMALQQAGLSPTDIQVLLYTGIAREYFEPATAAEVASRLGSPLAVALDVGAACAGMILGAQDAAARMMLDDEIERVMVCTASMTGEHLRYDIQSAEDLDHYGAGLTVGNASTAWIVSRRPAGPAGRIRAFTVESHSEHEQIARTPTAGPFVVRSQQMFDLQRYVPDFLRRSAQRAGWTVDEVDLWVCHQPSNRSMRELANALGVPRERFPEAHQFYGNTETSSSPATLRHLLDTGRVTPGMKIVIGSAAAGFLMATIAMEWSA